MTKPWGFVTEFFTADASLIGMKISLSIILILLSSLLEAQPLPQRSPSPNAYRGRESSSPRDSVQASRSLSNYFALQQGQGVVTIGCSDGFTCEGQSPGKRSVRLGHEFKWVTMELHYSDYGTARMSNATSEYKFSAAGGGLSLVSTAFRPYWMYYTALGVSKNQVIFEEASGQAPVHGVYRLQTKIGVGLKLYDNTYITVNWDSSAGEVDNPTVSGGLGLSLYSIGLLSRF